MGYVEIIMKMKAMRLIFQIIILLIHIGYLNYESDSGKRNEGID